MNEPCSYYCRKCETHHEGVDKGPGNIGLCPVCSNQTCLQPTLLEVSIKELHLAKSEIGTPITTYKKTKELVR